MRSGSLAALGLQPISTPAAVGRAQVYPVDAAADGAELWLLPATDEAIGDRLLSLGRASVGGFCDGVRATEGVWLARRLGAPLSQRLRDRKGPWPWQEAVRFAIAHARALAACESAALMPGPVVPESIFVGLAGIGEAVTDGAPDSGAVTIAADPLVHALVGARGTSARDTSGVAPLWTPPEQADGGMWDGAANRYVLGAVLYRLLSGAHPFGGAGLRHALDEARRSEAAPFVEAIAASLPSGLQSLTLRLLDPVSARRPTRAGLVADDLAAFLEGGRGATARKPLRGRESPMTREAHDDPRQLARYVPRRAAPTERPSLAVAAPRHAPATRSAAGASLWHLWPIAAGILAAFGATALLLGSPPAKPRPVAVAPVAPLEATDTSAPACASCHARQASEWRRSVMAHSVKSPLFNALEALIEEQVGRDQDCPNGAGILRRANPATACRDRTRGIAVTGSGGEHWCVNCHSPAENLASSMPAWDGRSGGDARSRHPVRDILPERPMEGISCGFCHQVHGPVGGRGSRGYQGNPTWTSFVTGDVFQARPEDGRGLLGIANSGYDLRPEELLLDRRRAPAPTSGLVHARPSASARSYLRSSEFCGSCHDVRLFGTDTLGADKGEHFKRLRNAYSEWADWARAEARAGRAAASCQDCHMSTFPGVCEPDSEASREVPPRPNARLDATGASSECPPGTHFVAHRPGTFPRGRASDGSEESSAVVHYFSGVDVPLTREFGDELIDEPSVDLHGVPLSARRRRDLLLRHTFRFAILGARRGGTGIEIPIEVENVGAGHRVPAGFSQEREIWIHLIVRDETGRPVYEVGRVDRNDEDLRDKVFERINVRADIVDARGQPQGVFGADVRDGPDVPLWSPPPSAGGTSFRGKGLVNFQNGFLRCVRCIGTIAADGHCEARPGQEAHRADRFADGDYDIDTGACRSNLTGANALFETYLPLGGLDASRGVLKGPDAIIDTRSAPPNVPVRYTFDLPTGGRRGPFQVEARLLFRAFPPYLVRAFAAYEREQASRGLRPSGPLVTDDMLRRLEVVELARQTAEVR